MWSLSTEFHYVVLQCNIWEPNRTAMVKNSVINTYTDARKTKPVRQGAETGSEMKGTQKYYKNRNIF